MNERALMEIFSALELHSENFIEDLEEQRLSQHVGRGDYTFAIHMTKVLNGMDWKVVKYLLLRLEPCVCLSIHGLYLKKKRKHKRMC